MKLIVRNLDRATTEDELNRMFQEFGTVQSCNLVIDQASGLSKGFGFIEMPKAGEAKAAIKNLNNKSVGNSKIRVKKAEEKKHNNKVKSLPSPPGKGTVAAGA